MERISFFYDGFNFYHSLEANQNYHKYKWLNFYKLSEIITPKSKQIESVNYFSAYRTWKPDSYKRHVDYVNALKTQKVKIVLGKYKRVTRYCQLCKNEFNGYHEEKQTDVNIALYLFKGAILDEFDTAVLCSTDTDLIPAIKLIREYTPDKKIGLLIPIGRKSFELEQETDFHIKIKEKHLLTSQMPGKIICGNKTIIRPSEWE